MNGLKIRYQSVQLCPTMPGGDVLVFHVVWMLCVGSSCAGALSNQ